MKVQTPFGEADLVVMVPGLPLKDLDLLEKSADHSCNVIVTSTLVLAVNKMRQTATFINNSDVVIFLRLGAAAAVNTGKPLNANGGSFEINKSNMWKGDVYAIHGGTGDKVLCIEEVESRYAY
ncbi:unnamed protein product [marine sediment metagenome]|uniref:Uncharacterized protein n=1 Tax=marine sediment metagenome TaxID=412755 RepID=X1NRS4_9ZZZZ